MKRLDPKSVWLFFVGFVLKSTYILIIIGFIIGAVVLNFVTDNTKLYVNPWLWVLIIAWVIFLYIWAYLSYHFYRYDLTEQGFKKESGVIWKKYVTIPYDRIQNVDIFRGCLGSYIRAF